MLAFNHVKIFIMLQWKFFGPISGKKEKKIKIIFFFQITHQWCQKWVKKVLEYQFCFSFPNQNIIYALIY